MNYERQDKENKEEFGSINDIMNQLFPDFCITNETDKGVILISKSIDMINKENLKGLPSKVVPPPHKGGTRRIGDNTEVKICRNPEHNPPTMVVLPEGQYEHTCPSCGNVQNFTVGPKPML